MSDESALMQRRHERLTEQWRPSRMFASQLRIVQDGAAWLCLFVGGDPRADIATGVCGYGDTPEDATQAFDAAWVTKARVPIKAEA